MYSFLLSYRHIIVSYDNFWFIIIFTTDDCSLFFIFRMWVFSFVRLFVVVVISWRIVAVVWFFYVIFLSLDFFALRWTFILFLLPLCVVTILWFWNKYLFDDIYGIEGTSFGFFFCIFIIICYKKVKVVDKLYKYLRFFLSFIGTSGYLCECMMVLYDVLLV